MLTIILSNYRLGSVLLTTVGPTTLMIIHVVFKNRLLTMETIISDVVICH